MLLGELAGRVGVARIHRGVLGDGRGDQRLPALRAARLELPGGQVVAGPRGRPDAAMAGAVVGALAVHHHGGREHQALDAGLAHGVQQRGRAGDVHVAVAGQVRQVDPETDQRGLVAYHVHAVQGPGDRARVTDVRHDHVRVIGDVGGHAVVHGRRERVKAAHLVAEAARGLQDV